MPEPTRKCVQHSRRAAEHDLLGVGLCSICARLALRAVLNQPDPDAPSGQDERVTFSQPAEPAQGQLPAGAPTQADPL